MLDVHKGALIQHAKDAAIHNEKQEEILTTLTNEQTAIRLNQAEFSTGMSEIQRTMQSIDDSVNRLDSKMDSAIREQGSVDNRLDTLEAGKSSASAPKGVIDVVLAIVSNRAVQVMLGVTLIATVYGTFMLFGVDVTESSKIVPHTGVTSVK